MINRNMFLLRRGAIFLCLFFCVACRQQKVVRPETMWTVDSRLIDEASLVDLPLPLEVMAYNISTDPSQLVITYKGSYTIAALTDFYHHDMERLGWRELTAFTSREQALFVFDKPYKWCIMHIQVSTVDTSAVEVVLAVGPKNKPK